MGWNEHKAPTPARLLSPRFALSYMSSHAHTALTTLGFSFGFVGIVGLVISLIALIPLNAYNIALSIRTAAELSNTYGDGSILIPGPYRPVQIFLFGSVGFSIMTIMLLLATCWRNASARQRNRKSRGKRVGRERRGSKSSSIAESIRSSQSDHSILTHPSLQNSTGGWLGKGSTLIFMLQFCWAIFGKSVTPLNVRTDIPVIPSNLSDLGFS